MYLEGRLTYVNVLSNREITKHTGRACLHDRIVQMLIIWPVDLGLKKGATRCTHYTVWSFEVLTVLRSGKADISISVCYVRHRYIQWTLWCGYSYYSSDRDHSDGHHCRCVWNDMNGLACKTRWSLLLESAIPYLAIMQHTQKNSANKTIIALNAWYE